MELVRRRGWPVASISAGEISTGSAAEALVLLSSDLRAFVIGTASCSSWKGGGRSRSTFAASSMRRRTVEEGDNIQRDSEHLQSLDPELSLLELLCSGCALSRRAQRCVGVVVLQLCVEPLCSRCFGVVVLRGIQLVIHREAHSSLLSPLPGLCLRQLLTSSSSSLSRRQSGRGGLSAVDAYGCGPPRPTNESPRDRRSSRDA
ncbi:hypothetical protein Taro_026899 [Colocasia esculenta]|uniref:Uncharacterized protein n=1 Tax=Colocasia esculenta TaxID=4460 RepID=A0A843VQ05_COLES|nr:hypothetical protein [Colocasia esculenta]